MVMNILRHVVWQIKDRPIFEKYTYSFQTYRVTSLFLIRYVVKHIWVFSLVIPHVSSAASKSISFLAYKGFIFCFAHLPLSPLVTYLESSKTSAVREMAKKKSKADTNYRGVLAGRGLFWVEVLPCKNCWVEVFIRPPRTNISIQHGSTLLNSTHHTCLATILNDVGWWWMTLNAVERSLFCHQSFDPTSFSIYLVLRCERQRWARWECSVQYHHCKLTQPGM